MPALNNPRHERFAQELAQGKSGVEAYTRAGYDGKDAAMRANASRLLTNDSIVARVAELQHHGAAFAALTIEELISKGREIVDKAVAAEDFSAASATLERVAKIGGLWVDRSEGQQVVRTVSAEPMSAEQWQQQHAAPQPLN